KRLFTSQVLMVGSTPPTTRHQSPPTGGEGRWGDANQPTTRPSKRCGTRFDVHENTDPTPARRPRRAARTRAGPPPADARLRAGGEQRHRRTAAPEHVRPRLPRAGRGPDRRPLLSGACRAGDAGLVPDRPAAGTAAPADRGAGPAQVPGSDDAGAGAGPAPGRAERHAAHPAVEARAGPAGA